MKSELLNYIIINPEICDGKPVITNYHYPVETMLELMAAGLTYAQLTTKYPKLKKDEYNACIHYAASMLWLN